MNSDKYKWKMIEGFNGAPSAIVDCNLNNDHPIFWISPGGTSLEEFDMLIAAHNKAIDELSEEVSEYGRY